MMFLKKKTYVYNVKRLEQMLRITKIYDSESAVEKVDSSVMMDEFVSENSINKY